MGIFSTPPEPDPRLSAALANRDRPASRKLAKEQASILAQLRSGEHVSGVGVDVAGSFGVTVVTNQRVFQIKRGGIINQATADRVNGIRLQTRANGNVRVCVDGPGLYSPTFFSAEDAERFARAISRWLAQPPSSPRDIPKLFPDYYRRILLSTGKPDTPENLVQIIIRVANAFINAGAMVFFGQADDAGARARFLAVFGPDNDDDDGDALLSMPDDIIDWLWDWHPGCHDALRAMVPRVFEHCTGPNSFLWTCGDTIPPWSDEDED